jgi:hypothetical protein
MYDSPLPAFSLIIFFSLSYLLIFSLFYSFLVGYVCTQGWCKPKRSHRQREIALPPSPQLKINPVYQNFFTINNTKFHDIVMKTRQ